MNITYQRTLAAPSWSGGNQVAEDPKAGLENPKKTIGLLDWIRAKRSIVGYDIRDWPVPAPLPGAVDWWRNWLEHHGFSVDLAELARPWAEVSQEDALAHEGIVEEHWPDQ